MSGKTTPFGNAMAALGSLVGGNSTGGDGSNFGNDDDDNALSDLVDNAAPVMPVNRNGGGIATGGHLPTPALAPQTAIQNATTQALNVTFGCNCKPNCGWKAGWSDGLYIAT